MLCTQSHVAGSDTSFYEPRKLPLVLDPVVASSQLTRVLINSGSSLNLLFASILEKMGLDISKMLTPSRAPFYGIIPGGKHGCTTQFSGLASHFWDEGQLPHGVNHVRGGGF
jgi:hypothetical protein